MRLEWAQVSHAAASRRAVLAARALHNCDERIFHGRLYAWLLVSQVSDFAGRTFG